MAPEQHMTYEEFVFEDYRYDPVRSALSLYYGFRDGPRFEEELIFDFVPRQLSPAASEVLDRIFRLILLLSGVSYYKAFVQAIGKPGFVNRIRGPVSYTAACGKQSNLSLGASPSTLTIGAGKSRSTGYSLTLAAGTTTSPYPRSSWMVT